MAAGSRACTVGNGTQSAISIVEASDTRYRVDVDVPCEAWLFLADANYPGWRATVSAEARPVYSAQVLGKAVRLNAGRNRVVIEYVPRAFYCGAALSGLALLALLTIGCQRWRRSR